MDRPQKQLLLLRSRLRPLDLAKCPVGTGMQWPAAVRGNRLCHLTKRRPSLRGAASEAQGLVTSKRVALRLLLPLSDELTSQELVLKPPGNAPRSDGNLPSSNYF